MRIVFLTAGGLFVASALFLLCKEHSRQADDVGGAYPKTRFQGYATPAASRDGVPAPRTNFLIISGIRD